MSYIVPITTNNVDTVIFDLNQLGQDVFEITNNKRALVEFQRRINISVSNRDTLAALLFSQSDPLGYLEKIRLETTSFEQFVEMSCVGFDLTNEMNDIRLGVNPKPATVTETLVCDYGIPVWDETTEERDIRNNNRITIVNAFRIYALLGMFTTASARNYNTTNEITTIKNQIVDIYELIVENDETKILIPDVRNSLDTTKDRCLQVLENKAQNAYNVITQKLERKYASELLAYQFYGELIQTENQLDEFADIIKGLNKSQPAHALEGEVQVVQV